MFGPPVAAYIQYCILKMSPSLLIFGPSFSFLPPPAATSWRRACKRRHVEPCICDSQECDGEKRGVGAHPQKTSHFQVKEVW